MRPAIAISILTAVAFLCGNTITWLPLPTAAILSIVGVILITLAIILLRWAMRVPTAITTPGPRRYHSQGITASYPVAGTIRPRPSKGQPVPSSTQ